MLYVSFWIKWPNVNIVVYGNLMVESNLKACLKGPSHKTKMAAMPIYGKNL